MIKIIILIIITTLCGCSPKIEKSKNEFLSDEQYASDCYEVKNDQKIYKTAAKFKLTVPVWFSNVRLKESFNSDCEITSLNLHFAYSDGELIPIPLPGVIHHKAKKPSGVYDKISFYISFKDPKEDVYFSAVQDKICLNKEPTYDYVEYGFRLCPYLTPKKNRHIDSFPFFPRFEVIEDKEIPTSFDCGHKDINGYSLENIFEMEVPYSCRGFWYWRKGASAMFDISKGKILKKVNEMITLSDVLLNSWIVEEI